MAVYGKSGRGAVEKITQMRLDKRDELLGSSFLTLGVKPMASV